jgi:UDP-N-acetylmuramate dehydrogenase
MLLQKHRFLSEFSTFGIGGPIHLFASVHTRAEMEEAFHFCKCQKIPYLILGKGSNCLFSDQGFPGLVIQNRIDFCDWDERGVHVGAGYSFSLLGAQSARKGLSGLEFASGIPATVGGAVVMNAGAHGRETADSLISVSYLHFEGTVSEYKREELEFSYRSSPFQKMQGAVLSAFFQLQPFLEAREKQLQIVEYRMKTQPLKEKSVGCIFRNPAGESAGALIHQCGLKGLQVGGAKVSEIHANFIVNQGLATAQDVCQLIQLIRQKVYEITNIHLETEIKIIDDTL